MSTTDTVLLYIITCTLSLFFLLGSVALAFVIKLLLTARRVAAKAEMVIDSVEAATETFKDVSGPLAVFKMISKMIKLGRKSKH